MDDSVTIRVARSSRVGACVREGCPCAPVLLLSSGIENVQQRDFIVDNALFTVRVCRLRCIVSSL